MLLFPPGLMDAPPLSFLLDALANPARLALSTRRLRAAYAGPAVRVRRASDGAELDVGFAGADLDTAALLAFAGSGTCGVATWYDQSGQGAHVGQPTTALQPRVVLSGSLRRFQSGRPCAPTWLNTHSLSGPLSLGATDAQAVAAANNQSLDASPRVLSFTATGDASDTASPASCAFLHSDVTDQSLHSTRAGVDAAGEPDAFGPHVLSAAYGGLQALSWVDGAPSGAAGTSGAFGAGTLRVGAGPAGDSWTGPIGEVVLQALASGADRLLIEASQRAYWGTP